MDLEQTLLYINDLCIQYRGEALDKPETLILAGAWHDHDYEEIATGSKYKRSYLQNNKGPKLWSFLKEILRTSINKVTFRHYFENFVRAEISGDLSDASGFVGRITELSELDALISNYPCVEIYGPGGIGKTALMSRWVSKRNDIPSQWKRIICKTAHSNSFQSLILEICKETKYLKGNVESPVQKFIELLNKNLLICIDSAEEIFNADFGSAEWKENRKLLKVIAEQPHSSCVVFISRRISPELKLFSSKGLPIGFLKLEGLSKEDAKQIFNEYSLKDTALWTKLLQKYGLNPLALKSISSYLNEKFNGRISLFEGCNTVVLGAEIEQILREQCEYLSKGQRKIMSYLSSTNGDGAVEDGFSLSEIEKNWTGDGLLQALDELEDTFLIERCPGEKLAWTLNPLINKFVRSTPLFTEIKSLV